MCLNDTQWMFPNTAIPKINESAFNKFWFFDCDSYNGIIPLNINNIITVNFTFLFINISSIFFNWRINIFKKRKCLILWITTFNIKQLYFYVVTFQLFKEMNVFNSFLYWYIKFCFLFRYLGFNVLTLIKWYN